MARLIRSEKEVEGRYEEVWTLVEEDALEQWPAGPGDVVGRPAARLDGHVKARGEARFTADVQLPGMLHTALVRSPHARARVARIDLAAAAAAPGVHAVVGPGELEGVDGEVNFEGDTVAALAAQTSAQARAALALVDVEWEELEPLLDPDEAVRRGSLVSPTKRYERGDPGVRVRAAHERRVQHAGKAEVAGVARLAAGLRVAVDALRRPADDRARPRRPLVERVLLDERPDLFVAALDLLLGPDQPRHAAIASSMRG